MQAADWTDCSNSAAVCRCSNGNQPAAADAADIVHYYSSVFEHQVCDTDYFRMADRPDTVFVRLACGTADYLAFVCTAADRSDTEADG